MSRATPCTAQVEALARYLGTVKESAPQLLCPVGVTHVQYPESNHAEIARVRPKGVSMSATASFLGETLALLQIQELQFAANGIFRYSLVEIAELVDEHLEVKFEINEKKQRGLLLQRLNLKTRRATEDYKIQVAKARARKRAALCKNKNKPGMSGAYASGGTAAAVDAASGARASGETATAVSALAAEISAITYPT
jgi:hypothetical protein